MNAQATAPAPKVNKSAVLMEILGKTPNLSLQEVIELAGKKGAKWESEKQAKGAIDGVKSKLNKQNGTSKRKGKAPAGNSLESLLQVITEANGLEGIAKAVQAIEAVAEYQTTIDKLGGMVLAKKLVGAFGKK